MNHFKHIRGISARASSNAALPSHYGQHADIYFENCKLKSQLLRSNPLFATKKSHNVGVKYLGQFCQDSLRLVSKESKMIYKQRSKTKSSVTSLKKKSSMHKKLPSENIAKRVYHYSTCQNVKFNNNGINNLMLQNDAITNGAKNINRRSSFIASVEKYPRSYAEMIADYSESLYKESTVGAQNDGFQFNNAIRKSPFSTFSASPSTKKITNVAEYSELSTEKDDFSFPIKSLDLSNRYNNTVESHNFQYHRTDTAETLNKNIDRSYITTNDLKDDDQSYPKLVAGCSKSMSNIPITSVFNNDLVRRNVLARNSFKSIITTTRKTDGTKETLRKVIPTVNTRPFEKNTKKKVIDLKKNDWLREMTDVMSDLKNVTQSNVARIVDISKIKESDILQPMDTSDNSLHRIHRFTELTKSNNEKKDTAIRKLSCQFDKINTMEKRKKVHELQKDNYSHLSDKISNSSQYFSNTKSSTVKKNSASSGNTDVLEQPQVKLRMVPSEKESVVSINVGQTSFGTLDSVNSASKHLSVIVQSNQKENLQLTDNQWNAPTFRRIPAKSALQRSDFGPMHISISEDSAPVKQIEFSINGKPVSELKSITARTERLDVVSSADKIEIRIPFAKDASNALDKPGEGDLSKRVNSNVGQILNVQISANFQDEFTKDSIIEKPAKITRYQHDKDTIPKSSSSISKTSSSNFPKIREKTLSSNDIQQSSKQKDIKFDDTEININKHKTGISLRKEINNVEVGSLNMRRMNITGFSEAKEYNKNKSSDNRIPSKMIPWWSSSDSFNKIRKKENYCKPLISPSNRNKYKATSSFNQNLIAESSLSKSKETSNSKKSQSNTTTSDFSNISANPVKLYEESKPIGYSFRLKLNERNPDIIPEIIRNGLKVEDNQTLTAKKDINKISGFKQMESITLFKTNTMSIKSKHDINIKKKMSAFQEKIKALNSEQNLPSKTNQEKKNNYSLKQTWSIDNVSKTIKSKIKILDAIKQIEKNGDTLDHDLKREIPSRELTARLNSGAKETQNPDKESKITTKAFIPNSSTVKIGILKRIDKIMSTEQTESIHTEKLKPKMNYILPKEKNFTMKNNATMSIRVLNKNDIKNIKEVGKNDFTSSSSSNFRNSPELIQILQNQEQLANDSVSQAKSKQNLESLLKVNKNGHNSSLRISSGTIKKSEKLEISRNVSSEKSKQNRLKSLTSMKNTEMTHEFEKLKNLTRSKSTNPSKESSDTIDKLPVQNVKHIQSKSPKKTNTNKIANLNKLYSSQTISTSKLNDRVISKKLMHKNTGEMSQFIKIKTTKVGDMIARIITQSPKSKDLLSKDCEKSCFNKSGSGKGLLLRSAGPSKKLNNLVDFKSAGSRAKSKSIAFEVRQNLNDVDMLEYPAPNVIGSEGSWINTDRPEKSILYSSWLQRFENDTKKNGKLF